MSRKVQSRATNNQLMDLVKKGYLAYEHPKKRIKKKGGAWGSSTPVEEDSDKLRMLGGGWGDPKQKGGNCESCQI